MKSNFITKIMALIIVSATLLTVTPISASAEWKQNANGQWQYNDSTGNPLKNSWLYDKSTGIWCHLNENGNRTVGWFKDTDGKWYYLNADGSMAKNTTIGGYTIDSNGVWIQNVTNITNDNLPIQIPSNWVSLGDNKYSINNRSVVSYDVKDMTGYLQDSVLSDIRRSVYKDGNYDSNTELKTYNGNNAYVYSYTAITDKNIRKLLYIAIFKDNKMYSFVMAGDFGNFDKDKQEFENVLNTTLVLK